MQAARGRFPCEIAGCKEKEHATALSSGGTIRWRRPGRVGRPEGGKREKKKKRNKMVLGQGLEVMGGAGRVGGGEFREGRTLAPRRKGQRRW